ncbi:MAG: ATP-binding protein [Selenomonadaceae bacterium]|nr:ATP-binding protein [Selenomonadaceae bacterium]
MNLQGLIVCRDLLKEEIFGGIADRFEIAARLIEKAEMLGLSGNLYRAYLIYLLAHEPNLISISIEMRGGKIGKDLREVFKHDIEILLPILRGELVGELKFLNNYEPSVKNGDESFNELIRRLEKVRDATEIVYTFIEHYRRYGYGDIATYRAFRWDKNIIGIRHFETIKLSDLIGYAHQKELLIGNTTAFVSGKPANNVLLVGARGTGKSSSVKSLVNEYYSQGLRLVQITKPQLKNLPEIMETLRKFMSKRFIIFLDDLSFEESESEYKYLKSAIEGGVESRPENVLIYATSNRRHLIRETWRDRSEEHEELYRDDSLNETISLSDRFGLIVHYYAPTQAEYLEIIRSMLKKQGIELEDEDLRLEGLHWEMSHSGRNGRTAQQFVNHYLGQR